MKTHQRRTKRQEKRTKSKEKNGKTTITQYFFPLENDVQENSLSYDWWLLYVEQLDMWWVEELWLKLTHTGKQGNGYNQKSMLMRILRRWNLLHPHALPGNFFGARTRLLSIRLKHKIIANHMKTLLIIDMSLDGCLSAIPYVCLSLYMNVDGNKWIFYKWKQILLVLMFLHPSLTWGKGEGGSLYRILFGKNNKNP